MHAMKAAEFFLATSTLLWTEALMPLFLFFFFKFFNQHYLAWAVWVMFVRASCRFGVPSGCLYKCVRLYACMCVVVHLSDMAIAMKIGGDAPLPNNPYPSPRPLLPPHLYISTTLFVAS